MNISNIISDVFTNLETSIRENLKDAKKDLNKKFLQNKVPGSYTSGRFSIKQLHPKGGKKSKNRKTKKRN
jgi:hypothetical protein